MHWNSFLRGALQQIFSKPYFIFFLWSKGVRGANRSISKWISVACASIARIIYYFIVNWWASKWSSIFSIFGKGIIRSLDGSGKGSLGSVSPRLESASAHLEWLRSIVISYLSRWVQCDLSHINCPNCNLTANCCPSFIPFVMLSPFA